MAVIDTFVPGTQDIARHKTVVSCNYQTVITDDGTILLHLSTFGSTDRQIPGKSSQSIQLTADAARELAHIIRSTFPQA